MSESVRFRVTRTSHWDNYHATRGAKPCLGAVRGTYTRHHHSWMSLDEAMRTDWFRKFTNHRPTPDGCVADEPDVPCWFVQMDGLRDLGEFVKRYGEVVVDWPSDGPTIEIYDTHRE